MLSNDQVAELLYRYLRGSISKRQLRKLEVWRKESAYHEGLFQFATKPENIRKGLLDDYEMKQNTRLMLKENFAETPVKTLPTRIQIPKWVQRVAASVMFTAAIYINAKNHLNNQIIPGNYSESPSFGPIDLARIVQYGKRGYHDGRIGISRKEINGMTYLIPAQSDSAGLDRYYISWADEGESFTLLLGDGTKIHANSETSVQYPVNMNNDTIHILVAGEAYIEIPDSSRKIYQVKAFSITRENRPTDQVGWPETGTMVARLKTGSLLVRSYNEEEPTSFRMISGESKISLGMNMPGFSTARSEFIGTNEKVILESGKLVKQTDRKNPESLLGWTKNQFVFQDEDIERIMDEIGSWYGVKIKYEGRIPDKKYSLSISRNTDFNTIRWKLELQGVLFRIHEKTVTVSFWK